MLVEHPWHTSSGPAPSAPAPSSASSTTSASTPSSTQGSLSFSNLKYCKLSAHLIDTSTTHGSPVSLTPIAALSPYKGIWTIKARVTAKSGLQHWSNDRGEGKFFDFDLLDAQGGEMLAKCFSLAADKFYGLIEVDKVYLISGGLVKPAHEPFNSDYEISSGCLSISRDLFQ